MPHISYFLYSESIQTFGNDPKPHLVGPIQLLRPKYIPSEYSFAISFGIINMDVTVSNELQIKFLSPEDEVLLDTNAIPVPPAPPEEIKLPEQYRGIQMTLDIRNVLIRVEGEYKTLIYFNGTMLGSYNIPALEGTKNANCNTGA